MDNKNEKEIKEEYVGIGFIVEDKPEVAHDTIGSIEIVPEVSEEPLAAVGENIEFEITPNQTNFVEDLANDVIDAIDEVVVSTVEKSSQFVEKSTNNVLKQIRSFFSGDFADTIERNIKKARSYVLVYMFFALLTLGYAFVVFGNFDTFEALKVIISLMFVVFLMLFGFIFYKLYDMLVKTRTEMVSMAKTSIQVSDTLNDHMEKMEKAYRLRTMNMEEAISRYGILEYNYDQCRISHVSNGFIQLTGYTIEELDVLGDEWFMTIVDKEDQMKAEIYMNSWMDKKFDRRVITLVLYSKDRVRKKCEIIALPVFNLEESINGFQIFFFDITERLLLMNAIEGLRELLKNIIPQYVRDLRLVEEMNKKVDNICKGESD